MPRPKPYKHQEELTTAHGDDSYYALFWEQGTGKSRAIIDKMCYLYGASKMDAALIVAPKGVHLNWILDQLPEHMSPDVEWESFVWNTTRLKTQKYRRAYDRFNQFGGLRILAVNYDALINKDNHKMITAYVRSGRFGSLVALDESHRIQDPKALVTKAVTRLRDEVRYRMIATGTPIGNSPHAIYSQCEFLSPGLLGHRSYTTFKKEYAVYERIGLAPYIPQRARLTRRSNGDYSHTDRYIFSLNKVVGPGSVEYPIIKRDIQLRYERKKSTSHCTFSLGENAPTKIDLYYTKILRPPFEKVQSYRNLDKLHTVISTFGSRVLKDDVFDLPPKIYKKIYMEMTPKQARLYQSMRDDCIAEVNGREISAPIALVKLLRMQQIVCGYLPGDEENSYTPLDQKTNPRIDATIEAIQDNPGKTIVWSRFTHDIDALMERLKKLRIEAVRYDGKTSDKDKTYAKVSFQAKEPGIVTVGSGRQAQGIEVQNPAQVFVGNQSAGGEGLTLHAASMMIFHSNEMKARSRLQAEDRAHRAGLKHSVTYVDIVCPNTVDDKFFLPLLREKRDLAAQVTGDNLGDWI